MNQKLNRRQLLRAGMFGSMGVLAAACAAPTVSPATAIPPTTAPTEQPAPAPATVAAPIATAPAVAALTEGAPAVTAVPVAPTAASSSGVAPLLAASMRDAATTYLNALSDGQRARTSFDMSDAERLRWHWTTTGNFPRNGLVLRDVQPNQRDAAFALLRASVSEAGFKKSMDIMQLQPEIGGDPDNYYISVFGAPGDAAWGWRWEGHHLSRHFTVAGDKVTITPFFHGVWPSVSAAGKTIMPREEFAARELMRSLDDAKRAEVIFQANPPGRHVTWNENYVRPLDLVGTPLSALNNDQQALAMEVVQTWLSTQADAVAQPHLDRINAASKDDIRFAWAGSLEERRPHYYRIQGPTFLLEHDNTRNGATHIHSVFRVFDEDFGQGLV